MPADSTPRMLERLRTRRLPERASTRRAPSCAKATACPNSDVGCAADDREGLARADINGGEAETVGVRMRGKRLHPSNDGRDPSRQRSSRSPRLPQPAIVRRCANSSGGSLRSNIFGEPAQRELHTTLELLKKAERVVIEVADIVEIP